MKIHLLIWGLLVFTGCYLSAQTFLLDQEVPIISESLIKRPIYYNPIAVSGEYLIFGNPYADCENGRNCGTAFIFEQGQNGEWKQKQQLWANKKAWYARFGEYAAISDQWAFIGTVGLKTMHWFKRNDQSGKWEEQAVPIEADIPKKGPFEVVIGGNFMIIALANGRPTQVFQYDEIANKWARRQDLPPASRAAIDANTNRLILTGIKGGRNVVAGIFELTEDGTNWQLDGELVMKEYLRFMGYHTAVSGDYAIVGLYKPGEVNGESHPVAAVLFHRVADGDWQQSDFLSFDADPVISNWDVAMSENLILLSGSSGNTIYDPVYIHGYRKNDFGGWTKIGKVDAPDGSFFYGKLTVSGSTFYTGATTTNTDPVPTGVKQQILSYSFPQPKESEASLDRKTVYHITNTARLIEPAAYPEIKKGHQLETINNKAFGAFLGGLTPKLELSTAITRAKEADGLYPVDCENTAKLALVIKEANGYRLIANQSELRAKFAPIDTPEEALSFAHLQEGGLPTIVFDDDNPFYDRIKTVKHVETMGNGKFRVKLVVSPPCNDHGEAVLSTYLVDKNGTIEKVESKPLPHRRF